MFCFPYTRIRVPYYFPRECFVRTRPWIFSCGRCNGGWLILTVLGWNFDLCWHSRSAKKKCDTKSSKIGNGR